MILAVITHNFCPCLMGTKVRALDIIGKNYTRKSNFEKRAL